MPGRAWHQRATPRRETIMKNIDNAALRALGIGTIKSDDGDGYVYAYNLDGNHVATLSPLDLRLLAQDLIALADHADAHSDDDDELLEDEV